ncbi:GNAT family N-acetyltransferase [Rothia sp. CCM 9419]|uniref:GNAT family N-acetyltransferase n=1 Tax=Rothia sp. CCM 9419 TaxID=3402662 RepID=UPI003AE46A7E
MEKYITLITNTTTPLRKSPQRLNLRPTTPEDTEAIARLLFSSYDESTFVTQEDAQRQVKEILAGTYGEFYPEASPLLIDDNGRAVAVLLSLKNRLDHNGPEETPTLLELITAPSRRREGIAEELITYALDIMQNHHYDEASTHISERNAAALALYLTLGWQRWTPQDDALLP